MRASKIFYDNEHRIKADFKYNYESVLAIREVPGAKWSKLHNAWHVPYDTTTFELLKKKLLLLNTKTKIRHQN